MLRAPKTFRQPRPDLRVLADEDLMALVHDGDARAFEVIFDRHGDVAFSLAYRMCGRRAIAEDIVQEAFLSLWRSSVRYDRGRGSVRSWVLGVVHNRAIDAFRRDAVRITRTVGDEGIAERIEAPDRTDAEVERRDEAQSGPLRAPGAPPRPAPGDRARLLQRLLAQPDRRHAQAPGGNREGAHAARADQAADRAWRSCGGRAMTVDVRCPPVRPKEGEDELG